VILENELLRVTVLADQGSDIIELLYKPRDMDFLWRSPQGVRNRHNFVPSTFNSRPFFDYYEGGWQELFPHGSAPVNYAGAELGFHGEVWGLPWKSEVIEDEPGGVAVRLSVRTARLPLYLERTMSLRATEPVLRLSERVVNEGKRDIEFMWGHHPALGPPFLDRHCILQAPARTIQIDNEMHPWPTDRTGVDHSRLIPVKTDAEIMKYLHDLKQGWVAVTNTRMKLGLGLVFDPEVFSCIWLWHEFGYTKDYPWFGRAYVLGVEPQSSMPGAHEHGLRLLTLAAGAQLETQLAAVVYEGSSVRSMTPEGRVRVV
jgi:galactose mutarotase-like enzyme